MNTMTHEQALDTLKELLTPTQHTPLRNGIREKKCRMCNALYPLARFRKNNHIKDGHHYICKACERKNTYTKHIQNAQYTYNGETAVLRVLAAKYGKNYTTVWGRIHKHGYSVADALEIPVKNR